jgi:hypothetical protein
MIIQGSNNPLVIQFDANVEGMPVLVVTLWSDTAGYPTKLVKRWNTEDMTIEENTAICPISEIETKNIPGTKLVLEAKGMDENGNTIFWDQYPLDVKTRRDRIIMLAQTE